MKCFGKKSQQIWTQHCQLPPDPGQICLTKHVKFEISNLGDWSCPPFWEEVSQWPLTVVGWHWQVDLKIYVLVVVHFWGYEVLMVNCAWCDRDKRQSNTCSDGKWQVNWSRHKTVWVTCVQPMANFKPYFANLHPRHLLICCDIIHMLCACY